MADPFSKTVVIRSDAGTVWRMLTVPDRMSSWMGEPEMNVEVFTSWEINSPIIVRGSHHGKFENTGTVLEFDPEKKLRYTHLSSVSRLEDVPENHTFFDLTLTPTKEGTELKITIENFPTEVIRKHLELYWGATLMVLKNLCEKGEAHKI
jgi:uncharacterized protein YndB with AHSA1/START domain